MGGPWIWYRSGAVSPAQRLHQPRSVGSAQAGAGIPARVRFVLVQGAIDVVIALHDVMQQIGGTIQEWIDEPGRILALTHQPLIDPRYQPGPQRSDGTSAADDCVPSVHTHLITGDRVRIAGDIRHASARLAFGGLWDFEVGLVGWSREDAADSPAARPATIAFVPDDFARDGCCGAFEPRAAAGQSKRTGGRKIHMRTTVSKPAPLAVCQWQIRGTIVARGAADRDTQSGSIFHRLIEGIEGLRRPGILGSAPANRNDGRIAHVVV